MIASAPVTVSIACASSELGKPVSIASVMACASGRSSTTSTSAPPSASAVAVPRRSASSRVDEGSERPAVTTAIRRAGSRPARCRLLISGSLRRCSEERSGGEERRGVISCGGLLGVLAELDHDVAEQVELVQHRLQRKAGVVDQEQLALVVAGVLAEGQGPLDDLFRRSDGQRGLARELLQ